MCGICNAWRTAVLRNSCWCSEGIATVGVVVVTASEKWTLGSTACHRNSLRSLLQWRVALVYTITAKVF